MTQAIKLLLARVAECVFVCAVVAFGVYGWVHPSMVAKDAELAALAGRADKLALQVQADQSNLYAAQSLIANIGDENAKLKDATKVRVVRVSDVDPGGSLETYDMWWHRVADSGARVVIDGECVSACTLFLGIVPHDRVCMTPRGSIGLHMASMMASKNGQVVMVPNPDLTNRMVRLYYPPVVQAWIKQHPLVPEVQYMYPADFDGYIATCDDDTGGTK